MTGEPPIGEKPPTKAQLKSPPPMPLGSYYSPAMQKIDFSPTSSGVITETVSQVTTTIEQTGGVEDNSVHKLQSQKSETKPRGRGRPKKQVPSVSLEMAVSESRKEDVSTESEEQDTSGRVTPDWIKQRQNEVKQELLQKEQQEKKQISTTAGYVGLDEPPRLSPIMPLMKTPANDEENLSQKLLSTNFEKVKKKEKRRDRETESENENKLDRKSKKKLKKKLKEKLLARDISPASSPDIRESVVVESRKPFEFPSLSETPKPTVQPIKILGKEKIVMTFKVWLCIVHRYYVKQAILL